MSTCPADKSREQPELSNSDRQLQFEAARKVVIQLIGNMDAKIDSAHDIQILTGVSASVITRQLADLSSLIWPQNTKYKAQLGPQIESWLN